MLRDQYERLGFYFLISAKEGVQKPRKRDIMGLVIIKFSNIERRIASYDES